MIDGNSNDNHNSNGNGDRNSVHQVVYLMYTYIESYAYSVWYILYIKLTDQVHFMNNAGAPCARFGLISS